jgi:hypothetical protein
MIGEFLNGYFEIVEGMKVKTIQDYEGEIINPKFFPTICIPKTKWITIPAVEEAAIPCKKLLIEYADVLVVLIKEKTIGEFGIMNEFKIPVKMLYKI